MTARSRRGAKLRRALRQPSLRAGAGLLALVVAGAVVGSLVTGDPNHSDFTLPRQVGSPPPGPSALHPLGVDALHRDLWARLAAGAWTSLAIALASTVLALTVGTGIGYLAAAARHAGRPRSDDLVMRLVDVAMAFPFLLLVTAIGVALDRTDATTVTLVLGLTAWPGLARLVRVRTLQILDAEYVVAARAVGASRSFVARRHVLPGLRPTLLVLGSHAAGQMILAEAVLSYLTVGVAPPTATWGRMLHEAEGAISTAPWLLAAPGLAILLTSLGFTRLGEGLRDVLTPGLDADTRGRPFADGLLVVGAVALAVAAEPTAVPSPPEAHAAPRGRPLRLATTVAIHDLDPALAYDEAARGVSDLLYASLLTWDEDGRLVGDLAERFAVKDGGRIIDLTLRAGLRFHDGTPLDAAAAKRSLERLLHPETPSPGASLYAGIVGLDAYTDDPAVGLSGVEARTERELRVTLTAPDAGFPARLGLTFAAPVCASMGRFADPKAATAPCGAGPHRLREMVPGERILLERFDGYHRRSPLPAVQWDMGVPATTQRYRFETGDLDLITDVPSSLAHRFAGDAGWRELHAWVDRPVSNFVFLNTSRPPFDDVELRRAVGFALDPSVLTIVQPDIAPLRRVVPPALRRAEAAAGLHVHDPSLALAAMARAGYPFDPATGEGGYPHEIDFLTVPDSFEQASAEIFQQQLAAVGFRVRLRLVAWATWLSLISKPGEVAMGWRGWGADYPDPSTFFEPLLASAAARGPGAQNVSFFTDPILDGLIEAAQRQTVPSKRQALFLAMERRVADQVPLVPTYTSRRLHLWQPWVGGYRPHPVLPLRVRDVHLEARP